MNSVVNDDARTAQERFREVYEKIYIAVSKAMVGQEDIVEKVLTALLAGGHVLLEGVPGLGKTLLVRTLGEALSLPFSRIQFTPDMMPADIQGTQILMEGTDGSQKLAFQEGPLVASLVLADEINRATPKTQSALLEAMQEQQITVGKRTIHLQEPFCVMATQNPIEHEGTYPLPEAQLDRFLFKLVIGYPTEEDYYEILDRTTGTAPVKIDAVSDAAEIMELRNIARSVPVPDFAKQYAVRLVMATQPGNAYAPRCVNDNVLIGSSPRGAQGLLLAGKVRALLAGRFSVSCEDISAGVKPVLRHRVYTNFKAQAEGVDADNVLDDVLAAIRPPHEVAA